MEGYINENRWIDLSELPRCNSGGIDWKNSVGYEVAFKYGVASGKIQILKYKLSKTKCNHNMPILTITIDKYVPTPIEVRSECLTKCKITYKVRDKIVDRAPHLIQYLDNPDNAYIYSYCCNQKIPMHCPICGYKDNKSVNNVYGHGFSCPNCSDGISIPNKIMYNILQQLKVDCIREVNRTDGFEWMETFLYDFYFNINNKNILIEMDGGQHKRQCNKKRDVLKSKMAKDNGFKLIRIDCDYIGSNAIEYIKDNILHSELSQLLPLYQIDWEQCIIASANNLLFEACKLWEEQGFGTTQISQKLGIHKRTVANYLKRGSVANLCPSYNNHESIRRGMGDNIKCIGAIKNNKIIGVFRGQKEILVNSIKYLGIQCQPTCVYEVCNGVQKTHCGFDFTYITREEYEQYKMILKHNEVVEEVAV